MGFRVLGFRVYRVWGLGFRVWGLGFRVWGLGFRGLHFRRWSEPKGAQRVLWVLEPARPLRIYIGDGFFQGLGLKGFQGLGVRA